MQLNPWLFLVKLVGLLGVTYLLWKPTAPYYSKLLFHASRLGVWLTEFSFDPEWSHGTTLLQTPRHPTGIFYTHENFDAFASPLPPQGIPAEWVMANLVLLIPLMLATPAPTWAARLGRLAMAMGIALVVQVLDVIVAIKAFYSMAFSGVWGPISQQFYGLMDSFVQGFDAQLFPFAIWAGIHFRELINLRSGVGEDEVPPEPRKTDGPTRAERRRHERKAK